MNAMPIRGLVIEDDLADYILIQESLAKSQRFSYQIRHIDDFSKASEALYQDDFDFVLLDYFLGAHSGLELLQQARVIQLQRPIIVMTGSNSPELDELLMKEGAADFIPKEEVSASLLDRSIRHAIERKQAEHKIAELVRRDPLTGLGNRNIFEEHMELAIARAERTGNRLAVVFLDLDRFKDINDSLGHHVGDLLLTLIGSRLRRTVRNSDFVARIGGDEFTVLLDNISSESDVTQIVEKISRELSRPAPVNNNTLDITVSIGIALFPENGKVAIELMQKADMALYESKSRGAGSYHFFTDYLQARLIDGLEIEKELRTALQKDEFELYYQPQMDMNTEAIVGFEALIRWNKPDGTIVSPDVFIPVAVRCGLIVQIGEWVLETACRQIYNWRQDGNVKPISVNVSPRQLKYQGFLEQVLTCVQRYQIAPGLLEIELTEEALIESGPVLSAALTALQKAGIGIAIDDFGTGYSSMRYLRDFPLDRIKIDKSFVSGHDAPGICEPAITRSIISLAQGLGLEVVAEGVETVEQKAELQLQGCRICQGYLYYKPVTATVAKSLLSVSMNSPRGAKSDSGAGTE
ncbi:putative bifunctional diguanylate cyclase/phosphodiesterase [Saccharospirillum impatiens]|uniref:putative bifunctional diguanylate cyclase/phosphodiesterase n=1 Tax=Saccharospirillum impatiens TaxID=169438 RepID=UPI000425B24C|nr:GGDEF domain-containing response regulator [Saccharospirillum impatiens]